MHFEWIFCLETPPNPPKIRLRRLREKNPKYPLILHFKAILHFKFQISGNQERRNAKQEETFVRPYVKWHCYGNIASAKELLTGASIETIIIEMIKIMIIFT